MGALRPYLSYSDLDLRHFSASESVTVSILCTKQLRKGLSSDSKEFVKFDVLFFHIWGRMTLPMNSGDKRSDRAACLASYISDMFAVL